MTTMQVNEQKRLPAISIIEVLISAALIGAVLTALVINMVYTQRTIENTYYLAKATDLANSCLNRFRASRDNYEWPYFCQAVAEGTFNYCGGRRCVRWQNNDTTPKLTTLKDPASAPTSDGVLCRAYKDPLTGDDYTYEVRMDNHCEGDRTASDRVTIKVTYKDSQGRDQYVEADETFYRGDMDAEYKRP